MSEVLAIEQFLAELADDASFPADGPYGYVAPPGARYPACVFAPQSPARDVSVVGADRIAIDGLYLVKVVDRSESFAAADSAMDYIDSMLHGASGTVVAGQVLGVVRESVVSYVEHVDGIRYNHRGGIYRIWAKT